MSALSPHIRVLIAEAKGLRDQVEDLDDTEAQTIAKFVLLGIAQAKMDAVNMLEAEQRELEARIISIPLRAER